MRSSVSRAFAEEPAVAPTRRGTDAQRAESRGERTGGAGAPRDGLPRVVRARTVARAVAVSGAGHAGHRERGLAANRDAIREPEPFEAGAKGRVGAVVGVDDDPGDREAGLLHRAHLRQRDAPLLAKAHGRRNAGGGTARGIVGPRRRQIEVEGERPGAAVGDQGTRHRHLAVADLPERAAGTAVARRATGCPASGIPCHPRRECRCVQGTVARNCVHTRVASHGEWVMKC